MYNIVLPKTDGVSQQPAAEMNSIFNELLNAVTSSGQTLSNSDNFQLAKTLAAYSSVCDFYTDSGTANAYVLTSVGSLKAPNQYYNGMRVRFYAGNTCTGASTVNVSSIGAVAIKKNNATTALSQDDIEANDYVEIVYNSTATCFNLVSNQSLTGKLIQIQSVETGAVATGTTIIPYDDTIPQNTEGDQYMSLAITPRFASSILMIDVVIHLANTSASAVNFTAALFQDSNTNALAAGTSEQGFNASDAQQIIFRHVMTAGTVSATTFKVRAGADLAGTTTFNGSAGARKLGSVIASTISIMEIAA